MSATPQHTVCLARRCFRSSRKRLAPHSPAGMPHLSASTAMNQDHSCCDMVLLRCLLITRGGLEEWSWAENSGWKRARVSFVDVRGAKAALIARY